jgi:hypothetical protein
VSAPSSPRLDFTFPRHWQADLLPARPVILPARHFTYPRDAEEIERGALEILVRPGSVPESPSRPPGPVLHSPSGSPRAVLHPSLGAPGPDSGTWENSQAGPPAIGNQPFLATCALGFRDPAAPTGIWSTPHPDWLCAVSGGYAYLIDTTDPERFTMLPYRPVLDVRAAPADNLLLFVGHHGILAWGRDGQAWESEKLSDEGITITAIGPGVLRGKGWEMRTDKEIAFALEMRSGQRI